MSVFGFTRSPSMQVSQRGFRGVLLTTQIHLACGVWKSHELSRYFRPCTSLRSSRAAWLFFSTYFFGWPQHWLFLYTASVRGFGFYMDFSLSTVYYTIDFAKKVNHCAKKKKPRKFGLRLGSVWGFSHCGEVAFTSYIILYSIFSEIQSSSIKST